MNGGKPMAASEPSAPLAVTEALGRVAHAHAGWAAVMYGWLGEDPAVAPPHRKSHGQVPLHQLAAGAHAAVVWSQIVLTAASASIAVFDATALAGFRRQRGNGASADAEGPSAILTALAEEWTSLDDARDAERQLMVSRAQWRRDYWQRCLRVRRGRGAAVAPMIGALAWDGEALAEFHAEAAKWPSGGAVPDAVQSAHEGLAAAYAAVSHGTRTWLRGAPAPSPAYDTTPCSDVLAAHATAEAAEHAWCAAADAWRREVLSFIQSAACTPAASVGQ